MLLQSYCQKSHLGDEICLYHPHSNVTIAQVPHKGVCLFLWFVLQIIETFYILLWDQKIIRSPVWHQSAACASDKSVKENGANQQRVRVASVQVSSKHMQLMVQYPNHRGIRRITYSRMANVMWWKTLLQILSPFLLLESDAHLKTRLNNEISSKCGHSCSWLCLISASPVTARLLAALFYSLVLCFSWQRLERVTHTHRPYPTPLQILR